MSAPTLPSILPCPFCGGAESTHKPDCYFVLDDDDAPFPKILAAWDRRSDSALLAMQRERDERAENDAVHTGLTIAEYARKNEEIAKLTEQLAASERTCAELRERFERCNEMRERQFTRAEAAGRTIEDLTADRDSWCEQAHDRLKDWDEMRKEKEAAERTAEGLSRGEFVCAKCGIRKDAEVPAPEF